MKSIDTNILVRYYTKDEPKQWPTAYRIILNEKALFVPRTVLLELEWVLSFSYELKRDTIVQVFEHLLGLANVMVEDEALLEAALNLYRQGFDFADALHWAASSDCTALLTFDRRRLADRSRKLKLMPPCLVAN